MDLNDLDHRVVFALVFVIIAAIRWIMEQVKGKNDAQDVSQRADEEFEDLYEEARREIVSRQTTLPQAQPPQVPARPPRRQATPIPQARSEPAPPPLPNWQRKVTKPVLSAAEKVALARFQKHSAPKRHRKRPTSGSRIKRLLSSPSAARDAIILSEILGEPKGEKKAAS